MIEESSLQMAGTAIIDSTGKYRYLLERKWGKGGNFLAFCMLNPSTANADRDDPTISRCISIAKNLGYDGIAVVNLFAFRATKPDDLLSADNPIGEENDGYIRDVTTRCSQIVLAWGDRGSLNGRDKEVVDLIPREKSFCLAKNKSGQPKHPLYVNSGSVLVPYIG